MKSQDQDRLLHGILDTEELNGLRAGTLELVLAGARARRHRRSLLRTTSLLAAILLVGITVILMNPQRETTLTTSRSPSLPESIAEQSSTYVAENIRVKFLSDDELLALFPDRPVALIGSPGRQELVFLDQQPK